jgi:hypothetical protein
MIHTDMITSDMLKVFETVPDLYLILSTDLCILTASDAYLTTTLMVRQEMIGKHLFEVIPGNPHTPEATSINKLHASFQQVMAAGKPHNYQYISMQKLVRR